MRCLTLLLLLAFAVATNAAKPVDLSKAARQIKKEPSYTAKQPLYGLVVFGARAKTQVWMVLDKSNPDSEAYDVLYADLNGNRDLTEAKERFQAHSATESTTRFQLPDFKDPDGGPIHTKFNLRVTRGERPIFMVSVMWRGELKFGGGYARVGDNGYMQFAASAKKAPIVWLNGDGPFRFQRWYSGQLKIGHADDFKVFVGQKGIGRHSFAAFQRYALPEGDEVLAKLIYKDQNGKEHRVDYKLKEKC